MADLDQFYVPSVDELVQSNLRVRRNALILRGVPNPNLTESSDHFVYVNALAQNIAPAYQNVVIKSDQQMPDTSVGQQLIRILAIFGLKPGEATGASGNIVFKTSQATLVVLGAQLIDAVGQVFLVTIGGTYNDDDPIPISGGSATTEGSTGKGTNHDAGDILQWVGGAPAFADATVTVAIGGLTGGADKDDDEAMRALLYSHLRNPAGGGNWSQVIGWAKAASASVNAAFVFPALNGPATIGLVVLGVLSYDATNGFTRETSETVRGLVHAYVSAQFNARGHVELTTQTPKDADGAAVATDVSIGLELPASTGAGGPGGGWIDAVPWPALLGTATRCSVSVVTDSTHLTLTSNDAATTPSAIGLVDGVTEIAWFSPAAWAAGDNPVVSATVIAHGGSTGAITVTLSAPFTGIIAGNFVFPNAENAEVYAQAFMTAMANLGPGQWYPNLALIPEAARQPLVQRQQPSDLTAASEADRRLGRRGRRRAVSLPLRFDARSAGNDCGFAEDFGPKRCRVLRQDSLKTHESPR
jgi:uncharacterized phage protein gp47/JayE